MRRGVLGFGVVCVAAGALALPSAASHERIELRIVGPDRVEVPAEGREETGNAIHLEYSPPHPHGQGDVATCWNGRFDREALPQSVRCSTGIAGEGGTVGDATTARIAPMEPGRYEAVHRRFTICEFDCGPTHWNASNVVTFTAVDFCRLTLGPFQSERPTIPLMLGAPVRCDLAIKGRAELHGEDGSVLRLSASEWITWTHVTGELPIPVLRLTAGGTRADLAYRLGSRLGRLMLTRASTPAVTVISVGQDDVSLVHRTGVTTMRVRRGTVVAVRLTHQTAPVAIKRYCRTGRPTIRCLSRIRYRFGRSGKIERARVLRAGQTARFKRARGVGRPA